MPEKKIAEFIFADGRWPEHGLVLGELWECFIVARKTMES